MSAARPNPASARRAKTAAAPPLPTWSGNPSSCAEENLKPHPARFPFQLPEFFIRFLTEEGDLVLDPFAGSCTTGEAAERLSRRWSGFEPVSDYLDGARFRFERGDVEPEVASPAANANNSRAPHRQIALL
jgi:DNA modification methylase